MKSIRFLAATALATASFYATPILAWAQETPPAPAAEEDKEAEPVTEKEQIVVTGTRIARPTLESTVPLTSVSVDELTESGDVSLGDALNDLPSLRDTFSSGNSTRFIGTAGLNFLDLRGLGTDRTLVLVNGRRHITSSAGSYNIDVNTIPVDLLERVDIVTGGNSAVYGSDAVAGVINFVLKRDYDGIRLRAQGGVSSRGDRGSYFAGLTAGRNFGDGRGNVSVALEYSRQEPLFFRDRDKLTGAYSGRCQFQLVDVQGAAGGEIGPSASDGIPDNQFLCGIRNAAISDAGTVGALDPASSATRRYLRFDNAGNVVIDTPTLSFAPYGSGNQQGGMGATLRNTGSLLAGVDRFTANLLAHYDISEGFKPFVEAKFVRIKANGEGQPSFFNSVPGTLGGPAMRCNNGFLSASSLLTLQSTGRCLTPATGTLGLARFNIDFGGRGIKAQRDTFRIVGGVEGTFNDDWKYEVAFNYGRFKTDIYSTNNLYIFDVNGNPAGFNVAVDSIVAPASFVGDNFALNSAGQKVICRVNATTNVDTACVPINVFGFGLSDPRALAYSHRDGVGQEKASEFVASAFIGGDTSQLFELPGGPIDFVIGGEYRTEKARSGWDELTASGGTFLNALQPFTPPKLTIKEAYGEIRIPLLKDMAFAKELSIDLAGRVSDYNNLTGTVYAYNITGVYAPISDIRFRAAYATSVRAPTQADLHTVFTQNFNQVSDPCDAAFINNNPNFAANCAAAGVPVGFVNAAARASSLSFLNGGNPNLKAERGRSITIGTVLEPSFAPGLSLTVDYYDIRVKSLIALPSLQQILNLCYGGSTPFASNPYCGITADDPTGLFPRLATGDFPSNVAQSTGVNYAGRRARGIDVDVAYTKKFDNGDRLRLRGIATYVLELNNYTDPTLPTDPNRQLSELGDPVFSASFNANYDFGDFNIGYSARYLGRQTISTYEAQHSYPAVCTTATLATGKCSGATAGLVGVNLPDNLDVLPKVWYKPVVYHNLRVGVDVNKDFEFYAGIDNVLDKLPPLGLLGTVGGDPYDSFGRYFYFGVEAKF